MTQIIKTDQQHGRINMDRFWGKPSNHSLMLMHDVVKNPLKAATDLIVKPGVFRHGDTEERNAQPSVSLEKPESQVSAGCFSFQDMYEPPPCDVQRWRMTF